MAIPKYPVVLKSEFCSDGDKREILDSSDYGSNNFSYSDGFPVATSTPISSGGIPPQREDFNSAFNSLSQHSVFQQSGGVYIFDTNLDYDTGSIIHYNGISWVSNAPNGKSFGGGNIPGESRYWRKVFAPLTPGVGDVIEIIVDASNSSGISDGSAENPFNKIQDAIDFACDRYTQSDLNPIYINVMPGTYPERLLLKEFSRRSIKGTLRPNGTGFVIRKAPNSTGIVNLKAAETVMWAGIWGLENLNFTDADTDAEKRSWVLAVDSFSEIYLKTCIFNMSGKGLETNGAVLVRENGRLTFADDGCVINCDNIQSGLKAIGGTISAYGRIITINGTAREQVAVADMLGSLSVKELRGTAGGGGYGLTCSHCGSVRISYLRLGNNATVTSFGGTIELAAGAGG